MNISEVSSAASYSDLDLAANMDMPANISIAASVKVLDMAQDAFSAAAERLIAEMAAMMTGVGMNVDIMV